MTVGARSECVCNQGYTGDGTTCLDVDECAADTYLCTAEAVCTNTPGSFSCTCDQGFVGDGETCSSTVAIAVAWSDDTTGANEIYVRQWNGSSWA